MPIRPLVVLAGLFVLTLPAAISGQAASTHVAQVSDGHLVVDGKPFFPIMQWLQCPSLFGQNAALGVNVFLGKGCAGTSDPQELQAAQQAHSFSVLPSPGAGSGSSLLGWHFVDEPDTKGIQPSEIMAQYQANRKRNPRLLNFLTVTAGFFSKRYPPAWMHGSVEPYRAYARASDMIGTDIYPVYGFCRPDWISWVADAQRELVALAGGRPTFQWIEAASTSSQYCKGRGVQPDELRAEVWMAITNGAKGIGYFTHSWTGGYSQFRVAADVQAEMRRTDRQLTALTPALLGTSVPSKVSSDGVDAIARRFGRKLYVFAVNTTGSSVQVRFSPAGLDGRRAVVIDEQRSVDVSSGSFTDRFGPLGVHLYRIG